VPFSDGGVTMAVFLDWLQEAMMSRHENRMSRMKIVW